MKLTFRKAVREDYEKIILLIEKENMKGYFDRHFKEGWTDARSKKDFLKSLKEGEVFILGVGGKVCGFTSFYLDKDALFIAEIQIKKAFQRKGFGTQVLDFIEKKASSGKYSKIKLWAWEDNPSQSLYKRKGYKKVSFMEPATIVMEKKLC